MICKYEYESFQAIKYLNAQSSTKIYSRIIRHKLYSMIYDKKNNNDYFTDKIEKQVTNMALTDQDFFIDLKLGSEKAIKNVFKANCENQIQK